MRDSFNEFAPGLNVAATFLLLMTVWRGLQFVNIRHVINFDELTISALRVLRGHVFLLRIDCYRVADQALVGTQSGGIDP